MAGPRPGGVTLVAVIAWIIGVLGVITGILLLTGGAAAEAPAVTTAAWVTIVIGIVTILVGVGLLRASNFARIVATVVFVLNLANAVWTMFAVPGQFWSARHGRPGSGSAHSPTTRCSPGRVRAVAADGASTPRRTGPSATDSS